MENSEPTQSYTWKEYKEKTVKKDGRANNGGKRANAGNKPIDPNEKKVQCYFMLKSKIKNKVKDWRDIGEKAIIEEYEKLK
jgi:hypothetical protein